MFTTIKLTNLIVSYPVQLMFTYNSLGKLGIWIETLVMCL